MAGGRMLTRGMIVLGVIALVFIVALFARPMADEPTPWEFFRDAFVHTNSPGKVLGLVFFTIVLTGMNVAAVMARLRVGLLPHAILVALAILTAANAHVRQSWLVRVGFGLLALGVVPLVVAGTFITDNPVGFGFLFAFLTPVAAVLIATGAFLALTSKNRAS